MRRSWSAGAAIGPTISTGSPAAGTEPWRFAGVRSPAFGPGPVEDPSFNAQYLRVSNSIVELQQHFISTRQTLLRFRRTQERGWSFALELERARAEADDLKGEFEETRDLLREMDCATEALSNDVALLQDTDARMGDLLKKMSRKLQDLEQTVGSV